MEVKMSKESKNYGEMLENVEEIISEISNPNVDLDKLVEKVELGYELIGKMKDRLSEKKEKIEQLHKKYEDVSDEA